jgi:hypothetical protein
LGDVVFQFFHRAFNVVGSSLNAVRRRGAYVPDTRKRLLQGLAEKGFGHEQLAEMQRIINAERSDLFDVLAYVAYALPPLTREQRAARPRWQSLVSSTTSSKAS